MDNINERLASASNVTLGPVTASFWMKQVAGRGVYVATWGLGGDTNTTIDGFALWMNVSLVLELFGLGGGTLFLTGPTLAQNQWYYIALAGHTGNSQAWSLWVNGTEYTGTSPASGTCAAGGVDLGGTPEAGNSYSNGAFAAYKHWNATLSAAEVQAERWSYLPQRWTNLWTCAPLLHTGNLNDLSGQGNGFTANGAVATEDGPPIAWLARQPRTWTMVSAAAPLTKAPPPRCQPWRFFRRAA